MGVLPNGILGQMHGRIAGVVGFSWKGKNVLRSYAKPSNPRTQKQQQQRGKFALTVEFAKEILTPVIQPYWKGFKTGMSEFNAFMSVNTQYTDPIEGITANNKTTIGSLEAANVQNCEYIAPNLEIQWNTQTMGNGEPTDRVLIVVWDKEHKIAFIYDDAKERNDGSASVNIGNGRHEDKLLVFLSFWRYSDADEILTSNSVGIQLGQQ